MFEEYQMLQNDLSLLDILINVWSRTVTFIVFRTEFVKRGIV